MTECPASDPGTTRLQDVDVAVLESGFVASCDAASQPQPQQRPLGMALLGTGALLCGTKFAQIL
jgi:hypothetical protein